MQNEIKYTFKPVHTCNMCGSSTHTHKVLGKRLNGSQGGKPKKKTGITTTIVKCTNCDLIYSNPQPIPNNIQDHYGIPPESYWKESYFNVENNYFLEEINRAKALINFKEGMKALDVGAGLGKVMIALEKAGFDAYGVEPSEPFHERAISKMQISPEKLQQKSVEDAVFENNIFDFITFGAVVEHLEDPSLSILKAMNWLKPNGVMHIEVPSSKWLTAKIYNLYYRLIGSDYVTNLSPMHTPFHLYEFGLKSFKQHAQLNNYEIAFYQFHVCDTFMPKFTDFILKPIMKQTDTGLQLTIWLKKKAV